MAILHHLQFQLKLNAALQQIQGRLDGENYCLIFSREIIFGRHLLKCWRETTDFLQTYHRQICEEQRYVKLAIGFLLEKYTDVVKIIIDTI